MLMIMTMVRILVIIILLHTIYEVRWSFSGSSELEFSVLAAPDAQDRPCYVMLY